MINKGDTVTLKPEWMDEGDEHLVFVAIDDMEKDRVTVMVANSPLTIKPTYVIEKSWIQA